jgi:hypothetical protein
VLSFVTNPIGTSGACAQQGRSDVLLARYPVDDEQAIQLGSLQIQAQLGDELVPLEELLA